jgi:pimeloyl-ACP methyl ester carboxylesterase
MSLRHVRIVVLSTIVLSIAVAPAMAQETAAPAAGQEGLSVGDLALTACNEDFDGYCGAIPRPLDPSGTVEGTIAIGFEWYPATGDAAGTIVAQEGGPGYSTTGSREGYLRLFEPLRGSRNILLVDKRGTGLSAPIDCQPIQGLADFEPDAVAACGEQLGEAAGLYGTAAAADDIAAVVDALDAGPVDFYGDSYGTYVGQVYAARHADTLRSIVLDSAYPALGLSPWFETEWATARRGLDLVCDRSPSCRAVAGRPGERLDAVLEKVRAAPPSGTAPDGDGTPTDVTVDAPTLFMAINGAGNNPVLYRDFDAAARAWLERDDPLPLLRTMAEAAAWGTPGGSDPGDFSVGLYLAVVCTDYPGVFDLAADPATRRAQVAAAMERERQAGNRIYAPFTVAEVAASPFNWERLDLCADWPAPTDRSPQPIAPGAALAAVPTMVLSGDIDSITAPEEGLMAALSFPDATFVPVRNLTHITAIGDQGIFVPPVGADFTGCVGNLVRRFIETLEAGDTSCAQSIRPIRTVPSFARQAAEVAQAEALPGNTADEAALRLASAAAETAGDVLSRYFVSFGGSGAGLRGGAWSLERFDTGYAFALDRVRWTEDLAVSGTIEWDQSTGLVNAMLDLAGPDGATGTLSLFWNDRDTDAIATIEGRIGEARVRAGRIAP